MNKTKQKEIHFENLNIVYWNYRSIWEKQNQLPNLLNTYKILLICLSEFFLKNNLSLRVPGFNIISKTRMDKNCS